MWFVYEHVSLTPPPPRAHRRLACSAVRPLVCLFVCLFADVTEARADRDRHRARSCARDRKLDLDLPDLRPGPVLPGPGAMSAPARRVRLKPWLLAQVDSGRYPGLHWLQADRRLFQIPWRHATRHAASCEDDNTIFKAWAVETGKFRASVDEPDPAKWKANLRCALNKSREFQLKFDGTKETPQRPFKIYEVCEQRDADGADEDEDEDEMPDLTSLSVAVETRGERASDGAACSDPRNGEAPPMETGAAGPPCRYDLLSSVPLTDLDLRFQYRGHTVGSQTVSNPLGCRLYSGQLTPIAEQVDLFGPVALQQIQFPGTGQIQNQKQRGFTEQILEVMERGLILGMSEQDIYAVRLCQCKVFWSGPGVDERGPPNPLERERRVRVFSLNSFLQGLISFQKGETPTPPPFEIFFCFGEDWPDQKPKEKKLVTVQVVPVVARILTEMFSGELSWSTDSIHLQISNPDVKDQTVEQFKELQRLLQNQHVQGPWSVPGP